MVLGVIAPLLLIRMSLPDPSGLALTLLALTLLLKLGALKPPFYRKEGGRGGGGFTLRPPC